MCHPPAATTVYLLGFRCYEFHCVELLPFIYVGIMCKFSLGKSGIISRNIQNNKLSGRNRLNSAPFCGAVIND